MRYENTDWMETLTGARVHIRTSGSETGGRLTVIDFIEPSHSDPPVYTKHEFIEVFNVLSGTLCFQFLGETCVRLTQGESVTCPSYKPHSFWNETDDPVAVQLICSPAGLDQFFAESDALIKSGAVTGSDAENQRKVLRAKYGLEHIGTAPSK